MFSFTLDFLVSDLDEPFRPSRVLSKKSKDSSRKMLQLLRLNMVTICSHSTIIIFLLMFAITEILENVNPDLSDSEFIERDEPLDAPTPGLMGSDVGDAPTPGADLGDGEDDDDDDDDDDEAEGDIDEELAAELDLALGDEEEEAEDEDDEEDEDDSEEDDEDEDDEMVQARKLLNEEIRDLEAAVAKKGNEIASSANPLIRVCYIFSWTKHHILLNNPVFCVRNGLRTL